MKFFLYGVYLLFSFSCFSQPGFSEADAQGVVDTFFEGFHEGDTLKMRSVMAEDIIMQTAYANAAGQHVVTRSGSEELLKAIINRPASDKWQEKLLDYAIRIDGNIAHVWTPYEFWLNDNFSHCGANAFTLARTATGWKIVHLIDSRRKSDCR